MPNVEIHGLDAESARKVQNEIFVIFRRFPDQSVIKNLVVTIYPTKVTDENGDPQPFLRLVNTCKREDNNPRIIKELKKIECNLDIEHAAPLRGFYPKKKIHPRKE